MIRAIDTNTEDKLLIARFTRKDNARAAAKRTLQPDEYTVEEADDAPGKFRIVLTSGAAGQAQVSAEAKAPAKPADEPPAPKPEAVSASDDAPRFKVVRDEANGGVGVVRVPNASEKAEKSAPAKNPAAVIAAIKAECGEATVENRILPPKSASEKAAARRSQMRAIDGGKAKGETKPAAEQPKPLDQLGDLSTQGTGQDMPRVPARQGKPLDELIEIPAFLKSSAAPATAPVEGDEPAKAPEAPATAQKPSAAARKPLPAGSLGELDEAQQDVTLKLFAFGYRKGLNARPHRADLAMLPAAMFRDLLKRFRSDLSDTERAAADKIAADAGKATAASRPGGT